MKTPAIFASIALTYTFSLFCGTNGNAQTALNDSADQPNIVLIFCDDLGFADVGFNAGLFGVKTDVVTPNIDSMAKAGTIFRQAYVAHPFCGPSRMALLSGRMPHAFGGQKNLPDVARNIEDYNDKGIPVDEVLISSVLQRSGYTTGCTGKWHVGSSKPFHPNSRGFDEFYGFVGGGHQYFPSVSDKVKNKVNDYQYLLERNGQSVMSPEGEYLTDMLTDDAVGFISKNAMKDKPFFLYLAYNAPHAPLQAKTADLKHLYPNHKPTNPGNGVDFRDYADRQNYVAMVYAVDRGVGKIASALSDPNGDSNDEDSILENTLVVFLSDNGGKLSQGANNAPLQADKGSTLEGGIRVPMFMHWPGKLSAETIYEHPVLALDFYPTFTALAGAKIPDNKILDGKNVWPSLMSGKNAHGTETMYWLRHHGVGNEVALRRGNLKAYRKNFGFWKIFDVATDPDESDDLASQHRATIERLVADGLKWSQTNLDPQWHDTKKSLDSWIENKMPKYPETFQLR
jgi:arylsulfatase A-like enzyme